MLQSPSFEKKLSSHFNLLLKKLERTGNVEFEKAAIEVARIHDSNYGGKDPYLGRVAIIIAKSGAIKKAIDLLSSYNFSHPDAQDTALATIAENLAFINPENSTLIVNLICNNRIKTNALVIINLIKKNLKQ